MSVYMCVFLIASLVEYLIWPQGEQVCLRGACMHVGINVHVKGWAEEAVI